MSVIFVVLEYVLSLVVLFCLIFIFSEWVQKTNVSYAKLLCVRLYYKLRPLMNRIQVYRVHDCGTKPLTNCGRICKDMIA